MSSIQIYQQPNKYPRLMVQQHTIARVVRALNRSGEEIAALALIRGAYTTDDGEIASLDEAKEILAAIINS